MLYYAILCYTIPTTPQRAPATPSRGSPRPPKPRLRSPPRARENEDGEAKQATKHKIIQIQIHNGHTTYK